MSSTVEELFVEERKTYKAHLDALLGGAAGDEAGWVLIKGSKIVGTYDTERDAIVTGYKTFGVDGFFVQQIAPAYEPANYLSPVVGSLTV